MVAQCLPSTISLQNPVGFTTSSYTYPSGYGYYTDANFQIGTKLVDACGGSPINNTKIVTTGGTTNVQNHCTGTFSLLGDVTSTNQQHYITTGYYLSTITKISSSLTSLSTSYDVLNPYGVYYAYSYSIANAANGDYVSVYTSHGDLVTTINLGSYFPAAVTGFDAGDFNCDGYKDVGILLSGMPSGSDITTPLFGNILGQTNYAGYAMAVIYGGPQGFPPVMGLDYLLNIHNGFFAPTSSVLLNATTINDFNHDGCTDILVMAGSSLNSAANRITSGSASGYVVPNGTINNLSPVKTFGDQSQAYILLGSQTLESTRSSTTGFFTDFFSGLDGCSGFKINPAIGSPMLSMIAAPGDVDGDGFYDAALCYENNTCTVLHGKLGAIVPTQTTTSSPVRSVVPVALSHTPSPSIIYNTVNIGNVSNYTGSGANEKFIINADNVVITGGGGKDDFVIVPRPGGKATITDFTLDEAIDFSGFTQITGYNDLTITQGSTIITLPGNQLVIIANHNPPEISASNFVFASPSQNAASSTSSVPLIPIIAGVVGGAVAIGAIAAITYYLTHKSAAPIVAAAVITATDTVGNIHDFATSNPMHGVEDHQLHGVTQTIPDSV
jgi:hypothetical protein